MMKKCQPGRRSKLFSHMLFSQLIFLNKDLLQYCVFQITSSLSPFKIKHEWLQIAV